MANVIVAFWTENGQVMYDAISKNLHKNGNNVMFLNMHGFISFDKWGESYEIKSETKQYLWDKISKFEPDLIFSFNNIFPHEFVEKLNCPVCVVDADTPNVGFWSKDILKKHKDRYVFLGFQRISEKLYKECFGNIKKYLFWPAATEFYNTHQKQDINISFIGSNFLYVQNFVYKYDFRDNKKLFKDILSVVDDMNKNFCNDFNVFKKKYFKNKSESYAREIFDWVNINLSGMERSAYLSVLSDLGLKIYGIDTWRDTLYYDVDLAKCFDDTKVYTFKDNLDVYNRSKIAINISHKQALTAFSWRVMDIMASNACLLMEDKPDWRDLFEKYLSPEVLDTVIYKDRFDMRQKAIKLLNDENLRKKCVAELNNAIEQNGRWEVRFKSLEKFLGIKLLNIKNKMPKYLIVSRQENKPVKKKDDIKVVCKTRKTFLHGLRLKNRYKLIRYLLIALVTQVPVLDLLYRSKKLVKLLDKIKEWWR